MNNKKKYKLLALDVVDGLDDNFYVVDINGLIGLKPIIQHFDEFNNRIKDLFGNDFYFDCSNIINESEKIKLGSQNEDSPIWISNNKFDFENKLEWRKKFNISAPRIGTKISIHQNPDYPKFLFKPEIGYKSIGIKIFNHTKKPHYSQSEIFDILNYYKDIAQINQNNFVEEFIPSKLIGDFCYTSRVLILVNESEHHPLLFLNRKCAKPIIKNLKNGILNTEESLSYLSNVSDINRTYLTNEDPKLRDFILNIKFN